MHDKTVKIEKVGRWKARHSKNEGNDIEELHIYSLSVLDRLIEEKRIPDNQALIEELKVNIYRYGSAKLIWKGMKNFAKYDYDRDCSSRSFSSVSMFGTERGNALPGKNSEAGYANDDYDH